MLQDSVLFVHVLHYKYYRFCSLDEALGIKPETQRRPRMRTPVCWDVPPTGKASARRTLIDVGNTPRVSPRTDSPVRSSPCTSK